ncbi:acetyltransferase [Thiohalomonas denitrificans]|uniref:Acetyltransferase n=1 Tax=Thiohalomonas denitrificans TaxID=415747 RepID=A0A1G5QIW8_9GAMM|nr:acetyltransferase [Thiohalomonas denitrificans]SCZ61301.1 hypothetical protein SAMN03097708_02114 [Thiohalomonas denitrificans]
MYLKNKANGDLVEILDISSMIDPLRSRVAGRYHSGEELQDPATFDKTDLIFPSGENLPRCWVDPHYRD